MSTDKMKVLVYGSTSVQGGPIARRLLEQGHQVRALIHHPEKAAFNRKNDLDDSDRLFPFQCRW